MDDYAECYDVTKGKEPEKGTGFPSHLAVPVADTPPMFDSVEGFYKLDMPPFYFPTFVTMGKWIIDRQIPTQIGQPSPRRVHSFPTSIFRTSPMAAQQSGIQ
jgi:hypothetical protein